MKLKDTFEAVATVLVTVFSILALACAAVVTAMYALRWPIAIGCAVALLCVAA